MKELDYKAKEYFIERRNKRHYFIIDFLNEDDKKIVKEAIDKISSLKGEYVKDEMTTFKCDIITKDYVYRNVKIDFDDEKEESKYMNDIEEIEELIGERICEIKLIYPRCNQYSYNKYF